MLSMVDEKHDGLWLGQLRRGVADRCVLALLARREWYGYDLAKALAQVHLIAGEGTIYPLLARLRREKLVTTVWRESTEGPPRRYYTLTPEGKTELAQFREQWRQFTSSVESLLHEEESESNARFH